MLVLLGAPLGNPADSSPRFADTLATADIVAAEDTRRLQRLASDLELTLSGRLLSYFEGNEARRTPELVAALAGGATVVVVTDGGMPSVSDPGFRLVAAAVEAGVPVTAVPGPSAVTTALAISGLPSDRFCFEGFLPRRGAARRRRLVELATEPRTLVLFEAPHRIAATLADLAATFGSQRPAALCRELTKTFEEVRRGGLGELVAGVDADPPRGEITLVVAGAPAAPPATFSAADLAAEVAEREARGAPRREAISAVARAAGVPKRQVYDAVVAAKST